MEIWSELLDGPAQRVLEAIDGGGSAKATAQLLEVSVSYICEALGRRSATGETEAGRSATGRRSSSRVTHAAIAAEVALRLDVTLDELRAWLLATTASRPVSA